MSAPAVSNPPAEPEEKGPAVSASYTADTGRETLPVKPDPDASLPGTSAAADNVSYEGQQVSTSDIQRVQNYIERCLQMYLSQREVILQLNQQFKVEPCFTQLVWQKLEEQNHEFFRAYYTRLKLKDQIVLFNHLLDEQIKMFQRMPRSVMQVSGVPSVAAARPAMPGFVPGQPQSMAPAEQAGNQGQGAAGLTGQPMEGQNVDAHHLCVGDFPGLETGPGDLHADLVGMGQSLPFSASEINLAAMEQIGSPGRGSFGGASDAVDLSGLPRNFSLSDLALDPVGDPLMHHDAPHDFSLSDLPALDLDSGGER